MEGDTDLGDVVRDPKQPLLQQSDTTWERTRWGWKYTTDDETFGHKTRSRVKAWSSLYTDILDHHLRALSSNRLLACDALTQVQVSYDEPPSNSFT